MRRTHFLVATGVVSLVLAALMLAPAAVAFEATDGTIDIIGYQVPPDSGTIEIDPGGLLLVFSPIPLPAAPKFVLEGSVFNKRSGRPVEGALVVPAFPGAHPVVGPGVGRTLSSAELYSVEVGGQAELPVILRIEGSDANGLYSTTADVTQFAGLMAYCVYRPWKAEPGEERTVTSTTTLPNVYTPYLRRDLYLNLPRYVSRCDRVLTYQLYQSYLSE